MNIGNGNCCMFLAQVASKLIIECIRNLDTCSYLCVLCQLHTNFSSIDYLFTQSLFHYLVVIYVTEPLVQIP